MQKPTIKFVKTATGLAGAIGCFLSVTMGRGKAETKIAEGGKSTFTIVLPEKAPASVRAAALELQRDIAQASIAQIPIQTDNNTVTGSVISLGATKQALAAQVTTADVADEGFRIVTQDGNVFIVGPDTAALITTSRDSTPYDGYELQPDIPGPQLTKDGGFSNGTANGVYTFLEDYLGVRWLMPGDMGRDVPIQSTLTIPDLNRKEAPLFTWRDFPYLQNTPAVAQWRDQQKLGFSLRLNFNHNWIETVPPAMYKEHPDWFAMLDGKRPAPPTSGPHRNHYKLETTNPELVKYFAAKAVETLKADPYTNTFSLSSSDSRGWSQSMESKALYDPSPPGSDFPSVTPLILKWYRDVSQIVAKEYPQGKLAGYLYSDGGYPPVKGDMKLPENFIPVITGKDAGYGFYREENRRLGAFLMDSWAKVAPSTWFYYSFGTWQRSSNGMVTPASPDSLNYTFSLLRRNHIKGARLYGTNTWSQGALKNYIQAKMLWNPQLDANELQKEWLTRAYGTKAGAVMQQFYQKLDQWYASYYQKNASANHSVRESLFQEVYGAHYSEMEKLFLQAQVQPMSAVQKQRLGLIESNMAVLQWRLRNARYLPANFSSPLTRTNPQITDLLYAKNRDFAPYPRLSKLGPPLTEVKVEISPAPPATTKTSAIPNASYILLYANQDTGIQIRPRNVAPGSSFLTYTISEAQSNGAPIQTGILNDDTPINFQAKAGSSYYFTTIATGIDVSPTTSWEMVVAHAAPVQAVFHQGVLSLQAPDAPISIYIPPALPLKCEATTEGVLIRTKTQENLRSEAAQSLFPDAKLVENLNDAWKFSTDPQNSGLKQGFAASDFNDTAWKTISATDWWQNQGFKDWLGTAWYRKTFIAPTMPDDQQLLLFFGGVDGDAVVYLNGVKVGEHSLSKDGKGWDQPFGFDIGAVLKPGQNTVAVQVIKTRNMGGIHKGVSLLQQQDTGAF